MIKYLKITLIVLGVLIGVILLDTLQARLFKNSPIISVKEELGGESYVDKGIIINTYHCIKDTDIETVSWHFKTSKYTCPEKSHNIIDDDKDEHSFFGKVIKSHSSYIIVEPDKDEIERNTSDKFHINLDKNNDMVYKVGTNVKITYTGNIKETYPAGIDATKIEVKSCDNFKLMFNQKPGKVKSQIIDKNKDKDYNYNVYVYYGTVDIVIDNKTYSLETALKEDKITMHEIIAKASRDFPNAPSYDDGGSVEYHYDDYTIIKLHTMNGNRDVYIGNKNLKLNDINW